MLPRSSANEVDEALARVEEAHGMRFGDPKAPLLLSVRSGARASMPGMMDTILNLGPQRRDRRGLATQSGNARFAWTATAASSRCTATSCSAWSREHFDESRSTRSARREARGVTDANREELRKVDARPRCARRSRAVQGRDPARTGKPFPEDVRGAALGRDRRGVRSWNNPRAIVYRKMHGIPDDWGTAVNVQAMVFGNLGDDCATGVAFTRNPSTGENLFYGEFLTNAQGEDVVAGIRTPEPPARTRPGRRTTSLEEVMPAAYAELSRIASAREHFRDMQDIEFTIQQGKLWMLQTRTGKRTGARW
jgi:pyruvate, orthophosphate dikinase